MAKLFEDIGKALDFLRNRKRSYQLAFGSPAGADVLLDLAEFCRANETTFDANDRVNARLEGRREVWLRIQQHIGLSSEQLLTLYKGQRVIIGTEETTNG